METLTAMSDMNVEEHEDAKRKEIESLEAELRLEDLQDKLEALRLEERR